MPRSCQLTGTRPRVGNHVSHSKRATKRRFSPNLHPIAFRSDALGTPVRLLVTTRALRTVERRGGIDAFLLGTPDDRLPEPAQRLKRRVRKALGSRSSTAS